MRPVIITNEMRGMGLSDDRSIREVEAHQTFAEAVAAIGTTALFQLEIERIEDVGANITVPDNIKLRFTRGGRLRIAAGATVTIESPEHIIADPREYIFEGPGQVTWASSGSVYPGWWGARGDGATDCTAPIQAAIDTIANIGGGCIKLPGGIYVVSDIITIEGANGIALIMEPQAILQVAEGYNSTVILVDGTNGVASNTLRNTQIVGGKIREAGTPSRNWVGIELFTSVYGIAYSYVHQIAIENADKGILLHIDYATGDPFINSNVFSECRFHQCKNGISFTTSGTPISYKFTGNVFLNLHIQADSVGGTSEHGIEDVMGHRNLFLGCQVWDYASPRPSIEIDTNAWDTMVLGGTIGYTCDDGGTRSLIVTYEYNKHYYPDAVQSWFNFGDSGATANADAGMVLENNDDIALQFLTPNTKIQKILFGDPENDGIGLIQYNHSTDEMSFYKSAGQYLILDANGVHTNQKFVGGTNSTAQGRLILWDGGGGNMPGYFALASPDGTLWYFFVEDDGTLKVHNAAPTQNADGTVVGTQT